MSSVHEKLKALDDQKSALLKEAKASALGQAEAAIQELNDLGFHYRLTEGGGKASPVQKGTSTTKQRKSKDAPCPICGFKTAPKNHDARSHRGQAHKKPFTTAELTAKGIHKVGE
jgi:hypothetical protein